MGITEKANQLLLVILFSATFVRPAFASTLEKNCQPGVVESYQASYELKKVTGYIPALGGTNGQIGTSASGADASRYSYEKYMKNFVDVVAIAVPRTSEDTFFQSLVRVPHIEQELGRCVFFIAIDRYGKGSNKYGDFGKMDILHDLPITNAYKHNDTPTTDLFIVSGPQMIRGQEVVLRDPMATSTEVADLNQ